MILLLWKLTYCLHWLLSAEYRDIKKMCEWTKFHFKFVYESVWQIKSKKKKVLLIPFVFFQSSQRIPVTSSWYHPTFLIILSSNNSITIFLIWFRFEWFWFNFTPFWKISSDINFYQNDDDILLQFICHPLFSLHVIFINKLNLNDKTTSTLNINVTNIFIINLIKSYLLY